MRTQKSAASKAASALIRLRWSRLSKEERSKATLKARQASIISRTKAKAVPAISEGAEEKT